MQVHNHFHTDPLLGKARWQCVSELDCMRSWDRPAGSMSRHPYRTDCETWRRRLRPALAAELRWASAHFRAAAPAPSLASGE